MSNQDKIDPQYHCHKKQDRNPLLLWGNSSLRLVEHREGRTKGENTGVRGEGV